MVTILGVLVDLAEADSVISELFGEEREAPMELGQFSSSKEPRNGTCAPILKNNELAKGKDDWDGNRERRQKVAEIFTKDLSTFCEREVEPRVKFVHLFHDERAAFSGNEGGGHSWVGVGGSVGKGR